MAMHTDWRRSGSFQSSKPIHKLRYGDVKPGALGQLTRIPDTNKKKREEAAEFFAQEKLLIEYWVSFKGYMSEISSYIGHEKLQYLCKVSKSRYSFNMYFVKG